MPSRLLRKQAVSGSEVNLNDTALRAYLPLSDTCCVPACEPRALPLWSADLCIGRPTRVSLRDFSCEEARVFQLVGVRHTMIYACTTCASARKYRDVLYTSNLLVGRAGPEEGPGPQIAGGFQYKKPLEPQLQTCSGT